MMSDQVEKLVKTTEPSLLPAEVVPIPIFSERDIVGETNFVDSKSSSTEGPDSSPRSNTSSPLAEVMIPAYPDPTELILDDGNDISLGSVCFRFWLNQRSAAQFVLRQSVTEPEPMSLPLNRLP